MKYLLLIIILFSINVSAQTKKKPSTQPKPSVAKVVQPNKQQTQEWIANTIAQYPRILSDGTEKYSVHFVDSLGIMVVFQDLDLVGFHHVWIYKVPIKDIIGVKFVPSKLENGADLVIMTTPHQNSIESWINEVDHESTEKTDILILNLGADVAENNMKERVIKAFNRLIELYSGKKQIGNTF
jgi:hypothetical protein